MSLKSEAFSALELWAGVECTVNRVGDRFLDQLERTGHARRASDLDTFAELGIRRMRYPVLWERTAPESLDRLDWSWADGRLCRLRELDIAPVVGLIHHGSGPRYTSLVDPAFPEQLAVYARHVAERYEWVDAYTPVNEPLTTARFSGLYGHWYPHGRDGLTFAHALVNECRATVLAMRAIREINPAARLVQTDDLGKTFSTPLLRYQADFENERRWLTFDLLCGRVCRSHPMWSYLRWLGVEEASLRWFLDNPCPPDVIGLNYYLTSERFLDERLEYYPEGARGGNGRHAYADVEAVRVRPEGIAGARELLAECWERYRLPMAVAEVHNGCTREEQLRWFMEVWNDAEESRREGVDVRAVTAWSLLGAYDWNSLVTRDDGHYEPGVFDLRAAARDALPRPTVLATALRELAAGRKFDHPILASPGWWRRPERLLYTGQASAAASRFDSSVARRRFAGKSRAGCAMTTANTTRGRMLKFTLKGSAENMRSASPLLITGATGTLGRAFARVCELRGLAHRSLTRREMDIADPRSVAGTLDEMKPWAVVNTAGYVRVDDAEHDAARCFRENTEGAARLAAECASRGLRLLTFSSDLVFDGARRKPYTESDAVAPLSVYGRSKAEAERRVLEALPPALVVRASAFFGPWDEYNFITVALRALAAGEVFTAADDAVVSPTYVPDLVHASLDLLIDGESGLWHLANQGEITWFDLARRAAQTAGMDANLVRGVPTAELNLAAPRPRYSVLGSERGALMPSLDHALARYFGECEVKWARDRRDEKGERALAASA